MCPGPLVMLSVIKALVMKQTLKRAGRAGDARTDGMKDSNEPLRVVPIDA